ncbi:hypothetical protein CPter91_0225 [Collimonas pratensis]|uniref:Uncharacterized protein n=1 Tax=Collimonas pratensis TaxID=279113 RepID=A0A127PXV9_9BURK|nr:hypothetical protein CPter91_0225 [Collimonas pratensis]
MASPVFFFMRSVFNLNYQSAVMLPQISAARHRRGGRQA